MSNPSSPSPFTFGSGGTPIAKSTTFDFNFGVASPVKPAKDIASVETWARNEFKKTYCNVRGKQTIPVDVESFKRELEKKRPDDVAQIGIVIQRLDGEISEDICKQFAIDEDYFIDDYAEALNKLYQMRPDLARKKLVGDVLDQFEQKQREQKTMVQQKAAGSLHQQPSPSSASSQDQPISARTKSRTKTLNSNTQSAIIGQSSNIPTAPKQEVGPAALSREQVEKFVRQEYLEQFHDASGKLKKVPEPAQFARSLQAKRPGYDNDIARVVTR
ncbi:hypothetical protein P280DRAFT_18848 [Massarina eburnea CBS 473.64]|uniref:Uncharacterized protein n=1 Tax=Massarina eburnea CBS 473.64 TaxID=1395130 RepID=A0A6A6SG82_9PLEO|nr:hypothetical protein P280DRAFT_18848 [Massarina eburnea CBS 473.64]